MRSKPALLALLALGVATLAACSTLRFGYNQLDTYASWTAGEYFDLDAAQKREFGARFERLHAWHRQEQLPDYSAFLVAARSRVQDGLTRADVLAFMDGIRDRYRHLVERGADDAAALLATLTPLQLDRLQRRWDQDNQKFVREHRLDGNAEDQRKAAAQRAISRVREWAGSLSDEQERRIAALAAESQMNQRLRHEDRLRRQREFMQLMAHRGEPGFAGRVRRWLADWEDGRDPEYQKLWNTWTQKQADYYVSVNHLLTPAQRASVAKKLQTYADDFMYLAQRPVAQTANR